MFSSGSLFQAPPPLATSTPSRRGSGAQPRRAAEPSQSRGGAFAPVSGHGNLYSTAIDFRPGTGAPVDAPQVAAQRERLWVEGRGEGRAEGRAEGERRL